MRAIYLACQSKIIQSAEVPWSRVFGNCDRQSVFGYQSRMVTRMSVKFAVIVLSFLINDFILPTGSSGIVTPTYDADVALLALIKSKEQDIRNFFSSVNCVNFIVGEGEKNPQKWFELYHFFSQEFQDSFAVSLYTEETFDEDHYFLTEFSVRETEIKYEGFIIDYRLPKTIRGSLERKVFSGDGFYVVVVDEEQVEVKDVISHCELLWIKSGSVTILVIYKELLWTYNPFGTADAVHYGTLETYQRHHDLKWDIMRNMNRYPLRIEFFESGYNVQFYKDDKQRAYLNRFIGPDYVTADILREKMNFTGG